MDLSHDDRDGTKEIKAWGEKGKTWQVAIVQIFQCFNIRKLFLILFIKHLPMKKMTKTKAHIRLSSDQFGWFGKNGDKILFSIDCQVMMYVD